MSHAPKLSVVMPTYNRANKIAPAIRSIVDQTFEDWELVIVDDGSTDRTEDVIKSFAHPNIKYHKIEHQNNISRVRNIGNELANGEIIVVQDSDDLSFPDRLEKINGVFRELPSTDVVYHGMYLTFPDPYFGMTRLVRPAAKFDRDRLKSEQYIPGQVAYKRSTWQGVPYNEEIILCDDFMFLMELAYQNKEFFALDRNLYEYISSPDSVNIGGEIDGRRRQDVITMLRILREKYKIDAHATLSKQISGEVTEREDI